MPVDANDEPKPELYAKSYFQAWMNAAVYWSKRTEHQGPLTAETFASTAQKLKDSGWNVTQVLRDVGDV